MSMTLYDIDNAIRDFEFEVDEETGEILNYDELDALQIAREQKIEGVGLWIKELTRFAADIKAEKDALAERQKVVENKVERLKCYLVYALQGEKFQTPKIAMSYRKSESVNIPDETAIPDRYCNVVEVRKPDKKAIKDALKAGEEVFGAELITKQNLQIK